MTAATEPTTLDQLAAEFWSAWLERHPTAATALGERRYDDRLEDESQAAGDAWRAQLDRFERSLGGLGEDADPVTRAALADALIVERSFLDADLGAFNVDPMNGPQVDLLNIPSFQPIRSASEADALLARWRAMSAYLDTAIENLRRGAAEGRFGVATLCTKVTEQLDELLARPDADWPLMEPAEQAPEIRDQLLAVIGTEIRPAFERYRSVIADEIAPHARPDDRPGLSHLRGGADAYAKLARAHTSLEIKPEEVHAIGLDEIRRIDGEFTELGARLLGTKDLGDTLEALRKDTRLYFTSREEVADVARASLARANDAIGEWFGRLPKAPCEVVVMPAHEEKHSTIAYYRDPAADGSRPGQFYINTYAPETRPRYEAETLAFHEAVPGHHLQLAIMQELTDLPAFRRFNGSTAYIEGWGLYTERLSEEMGLLTDETGRFGVLSFDAWRASRLVVDTGIHAMGWTRQRAIDFMTAHTALGLNNVTNEVDRYIAYPGQALAYKLGQLELLRLRAEARERQGDRFDIRRFHDAVLGEGALPLPVLRQVVERTLT
ncbi:MAG TPA: DUF885 domain-containing protein [Candidatus Limnocylindrales bacterium]|nr:DUF885 domain-containing protein [Candidatus Limnocylindrales bacterium]